MLIMILLLWSCLSADSSSCAAGDGTGVDGSSASSVLMVVLMLWCDDGGTNIVVCR